MGKEVKDHTNKLEALLKILEKRIENGEGDEEFIFSEVQEVEKDVRKENELKEEQREIVIEETKEEELIESNIEVEPIKDSMKMEIIENDYVEIFLDIKDNNEQILESDQIYDENDGKREELSRSFEKKDANFGIDFDTNQLIFAYEFFVILISMQVMKK